MCTLSLLCWLTRWARGRCKGSMGQAGSVSVAADGSFVSNISGCVSTGSISPASGARNYFNLVATAGSGLCATPGARYTGIAVISPIVGSSQKQMITAATTADKMVAAVAFGVR